MMKRLFLFLLPIGVLLSACSDNDSFSSDRALRLVFSKDTVRLDTLFATIPSSTNSFWVHNRTSDGLRVSSVRLERGGQSGFRVNVDGTFLSPAATDLEIRKGDSIRVFVEVTARENATNDPTLIEDNLLFTLESGVLQKVNLRTYSWNAEKITNLDVTEDKTIESSRPVVIYGYGIKVAKNVKLTIKNTTLYFHDQAGIVVDGELEAQQVCFRGDRLDHMFDYLPYDRVSGQWYSVVLNAKSKGCKMTDCELRNSYNGIYADSTEVNLQNTVIHNTRGYGLYAHDSKVVADKCQFSNALNACVSIEGGSAQLTACTLAQFYPYSGNRGAALHFADTEQALTLVCKNTLVTGYADDVVMGNDLNQESTTYLFDNCLLRTPQVKNEDGKDVEKFFPNVIWETSKDEIQGIKHFVLADEKNFIYDFTILEESPAYELKIGRAFAEKKEETTEDTKE